MSKSPIITDEAWSPDPADWLHNPHAGEILASEFLGPAGMSPTGLAAEIHVPAARVEAMIEGSRPVDADLDIRLARYFGMSEGFFLGLQIDYDLEEARRAHGPELDRIVRRAA